MKAATEALWSAVHGSFLRILSSQPKGRHRRYFISSKATTSIFLRRALTVQTYPSCSLTRTHTPTHARTLSHMLAHSTAMISFFLPPSPSLSLFFLSLNGKFHVEKKNQASADESHPPRQSSFKRRWT